MEIVGIPCVSTLAPKEIKKYWVTLLTIILIIIFFSVEKDNKLLVGGILLIFLGIFEYLSKKEPLQIKKISVNVGYLLIFLGIVSILVFFLIPEKLTLFLYIFPFLLFLNYIFLFYFGKRGWFRSFLFWIFIIPFGGSIFSLISNVGRLFYENGVYQFIVYDLILLIFAFFILFLIYSSISKGISKKFPNTKYLKNLGGKGGRLFFILILIVLIYASFIKGGLSLTSIKETLLNSWVGAGILIMGLLERFFGK